MTYKYQLHAHTTPCSLCAGMTMEGLIESLRTGGYRGCVITNHFMHGNAGIDRSLSWREFVKAYEDDYLIGKQLAAKYDLDLLFGVEEGVGGALEILCYGITPEVLYDNPVLAEGNLADWHRILHENGGLAIQAHPYRVRGYIPKPGLLPLDLIDGVEVINAGQPQEQDAPTKAAAAEHPEWVLIGGADTHHTHTVCQSGIETDQRVRTEKELVALLRSGNYRVIER